MKKIILVISLFANITYSQTDQKSYFGFSLYQDFNLAFFEDENGLTPFTANPTFKYTWGISDKNINLGYFLGSFVYTYADLSSDFLGDFNRWGLEFGFALRETNILGLKTETAILVGYGVLSRELDPGGQGSFEASGQLSFKIYKGLRFNALLTLLHRVDLPNDPYRINGSIGIEIRNFLKH